MLTSKEIIERTGISRATLNNYISSGLVPRPQVLPPGPQDGGAPRIGYFPDDTIERVQEIQRLKQEGWSITRIAQHFAAQPAAAVADERPAAPAPQPFMSAASAALPFHLPTPSVPAAAVAVPLAVIAAESPLRLSLAGVRQPAYLVDDRFRLVWLNEQARENHVSPLAGSGAAAGAAILPYLLGLDEAVLRFHVEAARDRQAAAPELVRELSPEQAGRIEALLRQGSQTEPGVVTQARIPAAAGHPARVAYAMHFREGVLFAWQPATEAAETRSALAAAEPLLTPVAVLVTSLQDAAGLWVRLTAPEYFELLNEVGAELDRVFRQHRGRPGRQAGEVLACYFLPDADSSYLWNALAAAQQTRDAMRQVSRRWRARKSWDVEILLNIGIDEGEEWMGVVGAAGQREVRVLGDAADRADQLARVARVGAIVVTRSLVGKLPAPDRQRLTYGVHRGEGDAPLLFTFARLSEIAPASVPARVAELAVAELLELQFPTPPAAAGAAG
ncbi:MerR family transcriptional regulator [Ramlibacter sp. G-1-2-2]|uniref:MerR family transcriptional regulator n=1 Tax=Ramlibacter agri TaxID=2728837 RepID=A0A848HFG5_9BURK|nr:adenylate/guanylate cyclase domain-containing protein [Ramlibacter agri]NML48210.1 MerR family transcriptional regulator [Ramlibacter agri]